ncbi:hypothetical protein GCM10009841_13470 [Microlunatus panaciterrae]|uniref:Uncharacterized membrane protein (DUF485 family) n=1 Tax=Microlunatus panaciterrae TaxID=400768 RepID=A0ABS2RLP1_9ACTN|nr:DUF998 domain-containing protein [Microlunatus panaciterrae]MBM7799907.1 uncharacterized membrane protein (DUF485 family) [Microlunatus panaciterrae]
MRSRPSRIWLLLGYVVLFSYNTWLLWAPMNGNAALFNGYLSELSASDQPNNFFFRGGDLLTALVVGAIGVEALLRWREPRGQGRRWWVLSAFGLVFFALSTFFDAFFAMDCSPTLSKVCLVEEEEGLLSLVHYLHTFTSVGAQIGIVTSLVAAFLGSRQSHRLAPWMQRLLLALTLLEALSLTVMMVMLAAGVPGIGYPQAVMVLIASFWFLAVGAGLSEHLPLGPHHFQFHDPDEEERR